MSEKYTGQANADFGTTNREILDAIRRAEKVLGDLQLRQQNAKETIPPLGDATILNDLENPNIPGYRVERLLGSGKMGEVYQVINERTHAVFAAKRSKRSQEPQEQKIIDDRFKQEIDAHFKASSVECPDPNIPFAVETIDGGDGRRYLIRQVVEGRIFSDPQLELPEHREVVNGILLPLFEMLVRLGQVGDEGIVPRDISNHNLFLAVDGTVYLLDMGSRSMQVGLTLGLPKQGPN